MVKGVDGKLSGQLEPSGELPKFMSEIEDNGIPYTRAKFHSKKTA
jgi:hypothetical protein